MRVVVNGRPRDLKDGTTLADLIRELGLEPDGLAAAVNRRVVPRSDHADCVLNEGDRVELVRAIGGG